MHNAQWTGSIYGEVKIVRHWMWMEFLGNKNYNRIDGSFEKKVKLLFGKQWSFNILITICFLNTNYYRNCQKKKNK